MTIEWTIDSPVSSELFIFMQSAADAAQITEGLQLPCFISVRLCDDESIRKINKEYRNNDKATDVLSFPSVNWKKGQTAGVNSEKLKAEYDDEFRQYFLGDIIISTDHAIAQGKEYGHGTERELAYLLVHGIFHLMGYDHMNDDEKTLMRKQEEAALKSIGLDREEETGPGISDDMLLELAREAMKRSYCIYSHYPVGAALLCADGRVYQGCNIENASFGLTNCAERTAVFKAVSEGATKFTKIAIASVSSAPWPCGACRQVLNEFAPDIRVLVTWGEGETAEEPLSKLLPHGFGPESL